MNDREPNHYETLQCGLFASDDEVRLAYRREMKRWHPDLNPSPEATARAAQFNLARQILLDPAEREGYDRRLRARLGHHAPRTSGPSVRVRATPAPPPPAPPRPPRDPAEQARRAQVQREREEREAREKAEGRRRDLIKKQEERARREAAERSFKQAGDDPFGWADIRFVPGHWYKVRGRPFLVLASRGETTDVRYLTGVDESHPSGPLWNRWQEELEARRRAANRRTSPGPVRVRLAPDMSGGTPMRPSYRTSGPRAPEIDEVWATVLALSGQRDSAGAVLRYLRDAGWGANVGAWFIPLPERQAECDAILTSLRDKGVPLHQGPAPTPRRQSGWTAR